MKPDDAFENKIKNKLEAYEAPYDPKYWKSYSKKYRSFKPLAFLKLWYMPYIYSSILFAFFWLWNDYYDLSSIHYGSNQQQASDTVYINKVVSRVDTLYILDTVYMYTGITNTHNSAITGTNTQISTSEANRIKPGILLDAQKASDQTPQKRKERQFTATQEQHLRTKNKPNAVGFSIDSVLTETTEVIASSTPNKVDSVNIVDLNNKNHEEEQLYLKNTNKAPKREVSLSFAAGPQLTLFSPISSNNFDTQFGIFAGYGSVLSINKFKVYLDLQVGVMLNEIDELSHVAPDVLYSFPKIGNTGLIIDDIELITTHVHLPLAVGYEIWKKNRFLVATRIGILGNYLVTETFQYSYENNDNEVYHTIGNEGAGLTFSHLNGGVSSSYTFSSTWRIEAAAQYYYPINAVGRSQLNPGGLSLQLGVIKQF